MKNIIVTVKMPGSMVGKLREAAKSGHFIDISEEIRSVVRQKWLLYNDPEIMRMKKLKDSIGYELEKKSEQYARRKILNDLEDIRKKVERAR